MERLSVSNIVLIITTLIITNNLLQAQNVKENPTQNMIATNLVVSLNAKLETIYQQGNICGFSVAIVNDDHVIYNNGFGYRDIKAGLKYQTSTIQNVASISKIFIGIALLKAVESGALNLDDPINKFLPFEVNNPYFPENEITIRHLATQTSTIKDLDSYYKRSYIMIDSNSQVSALPDIGVTLNQPFSSLSLQEYLYHVLSTDGNYYSKSGFLKNKPGELYEYSNIGSALAAFVLEKATGISFETFTSSNIFEPLKMSGSTWSYQQTDLSKFTRLYYNSEVIIPAYRLITFPDGGLLTSVDNLSLLLIELIRGYKGEGGLLSKESYQTLFSKQLNAENYSTSKERNQGVFIQHQPDGLIGHNGNDPGVITFLFFQPQTKKGIIILINTELNSSGMSEYNAIKDVLNQYSLLLE